MIEYLWLDLKNFWNERPTLLEFGRNFVYGMIIALAAAGAVGFFYTICVMILLWN